MIIYRLVGRQVRECSGARDLAAAALDDNTIARHCAGDDLVSTVFLPGEGCFETYSRSGESETWDRDNTYGAAERRHYLKVLGLARAGSLVLPQGGQQYED